MNEQEEHIQRELYAESINLVKKYNLDIEQYTQSMACFLVASMKFLGENKTDLNHIENDLNVEFELSTSELHSDAELADADIEFCLQLSKYLENECIDLANVFGITAGILVSFMDSFKMMEWKTRMKDGVVLIVRMNRMNLVRRETLH